jgi:hypothetical protein
MSVGKSSPQFRQPNSCSANQTANAATRPEEVNVSRYSATASLALLFRASSNPTDHYMLRANREGVVPQQFCSAAYNSRISTSGVHDERSAGCGVMDLADMAERTRSQVPSVELQGCEFSQARCDL